MSTPKRPPLRTAAGRLPAARSTSRASRCGPCCRSSPSRWTSSRTTSPSSTRTGSSRPARIGSCPISATWSATEPVHEAGEPGEVGTPQGRLRNQILIPRREVANTLRYRRRKGTLALAGTVGQRCGRLAGAGGGVLTTARLDAGSNHLRPDRGRTVDLRQGDALDRLDGPFDELAHTVDVRRINSHRTPGRHNIPASASSSGG